MVKMQVHLTAEMLNFFGRSCILGWMVRPISCESGIVPTMRVEIEQVDINGDAGMGLPSFSVKRLSWVPNDDGLRDLNIAENTYHELTRAMFDEEMTKRAGRADPDESTTEAQKAEEKAMLMLGRHILG